MYKKLFYSMTVVLVLSLLTAAASADELPVTGGLELHFDASAITGLNPGDGISRWNDISWNHRHAADGNGNATYGENQTVTGLNTVTFHGSFAEAMKFSYNPNDKDITIIAVACSRVTTGGTWPEYMITYIGWGEVAGNGVVHHSFNRDLTVVMLGADAGTGQPHRISAEHDPNVDGFTINTARLNGATGVQDIFRDGILLASSDEATSGVRNAKSEGHLGGIDFAGLVYDGDLAEILVYSRALGEAERQDVERYLYKKWLCLLDARFPSPADKATEVERIPVITLSWVPGRKATQHDVYFGTNLDDVNNANTSDLTGIYRGRQDAASYDAAALELGQSYYWRVDEVNDLEPDSPWKGNVWSFTVADFLLVDDFEPYNDLDPGDPESNRIYMTWRDGAGYGTPETPPYSLGNGTGSAVGHAEPPFAERSIAHSGAQSMPYFYDNNKQGYFKYSEAALTLSYPRDWTEVGVKALSLWFYGDPCNIAESMYVAISNSDGTTAVVYHDDPNAAMRETWTEWNIELKQFSDDVVLTDINSISIGFGDRNNPQAGGSGMVYFDDIKLYPPRCVPALVVRPVGDLNNDCVVDMADIEVMADNWLLSDYNVVGLDGVLTNFPGDDSQWVENALYFDNRDEYVDCGNDPNLDITGDLTIAFWAKLDNVWNWSDPFRKAGPNGRTYWVYFWTGGFSLSRAYVPIGVTQDLGIGVEDHGIGQWHHWAISTSFDEMKGWLYRDGSLAGESSIPSGATSAASNPDSILKIGDVEGALDEVRIYDCALSENEIKHLAGEAGGVEPAEAPVLWYKFDETSGLTADDSGAYADKLTYVPLPQPEVDLSGDGKVNWDDLYILLDMWLEEQLWPAP